MPKKLLKQNMKANFELNDLYLAAFQTVMDIYHKTNAEQDERIDSMWDFLYSFDMMANMMGLYEEEGE